MLIKDLAIYFRNGVISSLAKTVRLEIPEDMKKYIEENHLYHITQSQEIANRKM